MSARRLSARRLSVRRLTIALMSALMGTTVVLTACGPDLGTLAVQAMDSCLALRNPLFTSGRGAEALSPALPKEAQDIAARLNYSRGFQLFKEIAESAGDQATLVCALELSSYYADREATRFIERYLKHPSPDVATNAQLLLDRRR